jgi:N-acetylmuramic acid 6-phosphate etherase
MYRHLESKPVEEILELINIEDHKVASAVAACIPAIHQLVHHIIEKLKNGGRLFYIGAGTSGRLGILDASECPPTFGVPFDLVTGIIAGGDSAIRRAVEFAEDSTSQAWKDLQEYYVDSQDIVIGITASGTTPYTVHALKDCRAHKIQTACITSNPGSLITLFADFKIEIQLGPEFITGSTRMKSGTAQKLILNMISTASMIGLGRISDNKMVDMQLTNEKLIERGVRMIMKETNLEKSSALELLKSTNSVRLALEKFRSGKHKN